MTKQALPYGRYAIVDGEELRFFSTMGEPGYTLLSEGPREGFLEDRYGRYLRDISPDESLECVDYSHEATYRGLRLVVEPNLVGTLVIILITNDNRYPETDEDAREAGLEFQEPGLWNKIVQPDDPDLTVVTTRTPIDPPWFKRPPAAL